MIKSKDTGKPRLACLVDEFFHRPTMFIFIAGVHCTAPFFSKEKGRELIEQLFKDGKIDVLWKRGLLHMLDDSSLPDGADVFDTLMPRVKSMEFISNKIFDPATRAAISGDIVKAVVYLARLHKYLASLQVLSSM